MQNQNKDSVKAIYLELKGRLSAAPPIDTKKIEDETLWKDFNKLLDRLSSATGNEDYKTFSISPKQSYYGTQRDPYYYNYILTSEYRTKLNGLIMRLYGEFFSDETEPFGERPGQIINQTQGQIQTTQIQLIIDFRSLIDEKLYNSKLEEKEKDFLKKLKNALSGIKSITDIIKLIIITAKEFGFGLETILKIFT